MSNLSPDNRPPADPATPAFNRSTGLTVLMVLVGIVLLFPGLCVLTLAAIMVPTEGLKILNDSEVWFMIILPCFAVSALGIYLLIRAGRKRRGCPPDRES